ncbi:PhoX family protein, partial [Pseudomaricurvus sp.]|uniref:PhoX family protein n=1 Tax=Pseudomaricurvus sp. TaxID=2004510 RepID=UPI003F6D4F77
MTAKHMNTLSRRSFLRNITHSSAGLASASALAGTLSGCQDDSNLSFTEIPHSLDHSHHIPDEYQSSTLLSWGDALHSTEPFKPETLTADDQTQRFGYNNDFIGFMPLTDDDNLSATEHYHSGNSQRGLLCINHEYTQPHLMFSGYQDEDDGEFNTRREHVAIELQACGHSVVEVEFRNGDWQVNTDSPYNRRITVTTPMTITGPAAGHPRLQTSTDPSGKTVLGTAGNCAGGKTPWGSVLIAEEGIGGLFMGDVNTLSKQEHDNYQRLSIGEDDNRQ